VHHLYSWIKRDQLDVTCFIISLFNAQLVSDVNTSILRSLRLICWVISWVVLLWYDVCWRYVVVWLGWYGIRIPYTYRCDDTRGCVMQFWPPDDERMCSKHVGAWNKTYCETNYCASSWLNIEINILQCMVNKMSKLHTCCTAVVFWFAKLGCKL